MALSIWRYNSSQLSLSQERMCAASDSLSMHMAQRRVIIRRDSITPSVKLCSRQKHITRKKTRSNEKHHQTPKALSQVVGGGGRRAESFARSQPSASSPYNLQEDVSLNCCFALGTYGRPLRNGKDVGSGEEAGIGP